MYTVVYFFPDTLYIVMSWACRRCNKQRCDDAALDAVTACGLVRATPDVVDATHHSVHARR